MSKEILSDEENRYYFYLYKNGDNKARDILITKNVGLVGYTMKQLNLNYSNVVFSFEDFFSVGVIGLTLAVDNFDINRNVTFSTCAIKYIRTAIISEIRKKRIVPVEISCDEDYNYQELPYYEDGFDEFIDKETLRCGLNTLTERQKEVASLYYGIGCERRKPSEICSYFNFSKNNLYITIRNVESKLKKYFKVEENKIKI